MSYRDVERVDLHVRGAVDGSFCLKPGDVEQRAVPVVVRPVDLQRRLAERAGTVVEELMEQNVHAVNIKS